MLDPCKWGIAIVSARGALVGLMGARQEQRLFAEYVGLATLWPRISVSHLANWKPNDPW